ncbi:hypothetical protein D3C71_897760 [compost metagenome]
MSLIQPLQNTAAIRVTAREIPARVSAVAGATTCSAPARPMAMLQATWATDRPITMITGPITTGGSSLCTKPMPRTRMRAARMKYMKPAANRPNMVEGRPQVWVA